MNKKICVLVNNAASFYAGYFEELTPEQVDRQLAVSLTGPMHVTRAVLPVMRRQRAGHIISISSSAGLAAGFDFVSAYAASKFGLEGWMESLHTEIAPFGIATTIVNPGFFRTELLTEQSTSYAEPSVADYDERRAPMPSPRRSRRSPTCRRRSRRIVRCRRLSISTRRRPPCARGRTPTWRRWRSRSPLLLRSTARSSSASPACARRGCRG
jgi:NAD(P)-dependent dehydrogenase (short-subunit alcohol dehydrogenase family)